MKTGDHAVTVEGNIIFQSRRKLRVWLNPEKSAIELRRDYSLMDQIGNVGLYS